MPRHPLGTGNVLPVPPFNLEEVRFWLHIMEEHALFIKNGLPFDKPDLIEEATAFEREFKALRVRAEKISGEKKFTELIADSINSVKEFIRYKQLLLGLSMTNQLGSALPPLFFDHIIREAEYFLAILEKFRAGKKLAVVKALEADFWLRIMEEHTNFIDSRLDPSERSLLAVVRDYETEFDNLSQQSRDYVSFFEHKPMDLPAFDRFLQDSRAATVRLRDFKQAAYDMIEKDRMLSTIPAMMADHFRREADHFLLVLAMMEKGVVKVEKDVAAFKNNQIAALSTMEEELCDELPDSFVFPEREPQVDEPIDDMELDYTPSSQREELPDSDVSPISPKWENVEDNEAELVAIEDNVKTQEPDEVAITANVVEPEKVMLPPKPSAKPEKRKQGKYKWGGNWPRQLGKIK
ncbi:DUF2935 domain-containing protein [Sporomusa acidovorans]|uniref:DUF2935 domain-containing protein n=1 Tax=Sporomusa acidovorans (strain ATCC 49682 / DSM 3132 / Mol) TaxID=1123286 RepID=A0ABZ3JBM9_SPOA4|nr:DUF2935 domain-containing protein [Sporomusa acidovorans]OZC13286.1 hypothetical protein SPACI_57810 [Sporomusa acidovorans DSM 3132]SDD98182.1 protein of unknown function [Sporomusa acidovorans]